MKTIYIEIRYAFRLLKYGLKNLWRWFPVIWKDKDYDDHFIFEILKFKIKNTAEYIEDSAFFVGYEHEVSRMRLVNKLIGLVQSQFYDMEFMDYQDTTYEFIPSDVMDENGKSLYYEMKSEVINDKLDDYFVKYPLVYKKVIKQLGPDASRTSIAIRMSHENHKRAKRLLFDILNTHIENWWN